MNDRERYMCIILRNFLWYPLLFLGVCNIAKDGAMNCIFTHMYWTVLHNCTVYNVYNINL